jgi:hypothetical protein
MRTRYRTALGAAGLLLAAAGFAAEEDFHTWPSVVATAGGIAGLPELNLWAEGQARFNDDTSRLNQGVLRGALGWRVAPRTVLWAGYAWFPTRPQGGSAFDEHRPWQQLTWRAAAPLAGFGLSTRTRLEQRLVENADDTAWRFRQLVKLTWPLAADDRVYLALWDEVFANFNDTDWGAASGFDQNRAFVGLGARLSPLVRTELGYMNLYVDRRGRRNASNHVLLLTLFLDF